MDTSLPPRSRFAFLVHPRTDLRADLATVNPLLGVLPSGFYEQALRRLPIRPWLQAEIRAADRPDEPFGEVIVVPLSPRQLLGGDRVLVKRRMDEAIEFAASRGAELVGLGALTAPATGGGARLRSRRDVGVTNGNAFTAAATVRAAAAIAAGLARPPVIALVGATGSVGGAVTRMVAASGIASELLLVARTSGTLTALAAELGPGVTTSVRLEDCRRADLVVLMTAAPDALLEPEHLRHGAIVLDDTQPRNTGRGLLAARPDVTVLDGGLVLTPGLLRTGRSIGIDAGTSFACLAEAALLALDGHRGHGTIGRPSLQQVARMDGLAAEYASLGFQLAPPTSFGRPVTVAGWNDAEAARVGVAA
ncbi:MAG: fatty aldehyde-rating acyl-ACP reductase [Microbacteriaceae bacterium]|nr:fatty aldehyde-rating acyl-ACP reductase [Microbacteriaceae bacterium]